MEVSPDGIELKIEITEKCQAQCTFCHRNFGARKSRQAMPRDEVLSWIDWAVEEGITRIRFTGGEPTLHPNLWEFCRVCFEHQISVIVNTNGLGPFARVEKILLNLLA